MRTSILALALALTLPGTLLAQNAKNASMAAVAANKHYTQGWSAIRVESWDAAVREFESAIDSDPKFALAYYSLGRAHMGRRDFAAAIDAYTKCRDLFLGGGSEGFTSQVEMRQHLNDRIFEYQTELNQATSQLSGQGATSQSRSLYIRELQAKISRLEQARDRSTNITIDTEVPYFVPMALGAAYYRTGRFADAEREYRTALSANGASGETHNNLAVLYLTTGRYDEADAEVRAAEKVGFRVAEALKGDIKRKRTGG